MKPLDKLGQDNGVIVVSLALRHFFNARLSSPAAATSVLGVEKAELCQLFL